VVLARLDAEEGEQLVLPLADERLGDDEQDALRSFGPALGDDQPRLDGLSHAHLVREDAAALAQAAEGEDHGVHLVRIGIDPGLPLGRRVPLAFIWSTDADELLS
jgi:hypothetical protein